MTTEAVTSVNEPSTNPSVDGDTPKGNRLSADKSTLRQMVRERITDQQLHAILDRVVTMATEGHWQAMKWVLANIFGKAPTVTEIKKVDRGIAEEELAAQAHASPEAPAANGVFSTEAPPSSDPPIANGVFEPRNRKERRALQKAQRIAARKGVLQAS